MRLKLHQVSVLSARLAQVCKTCFSWRDWAAPTVASLFLWLALKDPSQGRRQTPASQPASPRAVFRAEDCLGPLAGRGALQGSSSGIAPSSTHRHRRLQGLTWRVGDYPVPPAVRRSGTPGQPAGLQARSSAWLGHALQTIQNRAGSSLPQQPSAASSAALIGATASGSTSIWAATGSIAANVAKAVRASTGRR